MAKMCDICGVRPATVRARVTSSDGQSEVLDLCDVDYRRLARQQRSSSPLESLFGGRGSLFDDFFDDDEFLGRSAGRGRAPEEAEAGPASGAARGAPGGPARTRGGAARSGGGAENLSENAMEMLQGAARRAAESGRREVDTEHLLLALTESDVVRIILDQFKVSLDDLRHQVERETKQESGRKRRRSEG